MGDISLAKASQRGELRKIIEMEHLVKELNKTNTEKEKAEIRKRLDQIILELKEIDNYKNINWWKSNIILTIIISTGLISIILFLIATFLRRG